MIKLIADSSCDIFHMDGVDFYSAPMTISAGDKTYVDDGHLDINAMLDHLSSHNGRSYTACPAIGEWLKAFEGGDWIFVGTITSNLSGTYRSAMAAKELYLQSHPDAKIHVFDTLSTGPELRMLMEKLAELSKTGLSFEAIREAGENYLKKTRLFFALQSLHNMAQNGRVSHLVATAIGVMNIRIVGTASTEGTLESLSKCRGDKKAMESMFAHMEKAGYRGGKVFINHIQAPSLAEAFAKLIRSKYPQAPILTYPASGLCSYYAERNGLMVGMEQG